MHQSVRPRARVPRARDRTGGETGGETGGGTGGETGSGRRFHPARRASICDWVYLGWVNFGRLLRDRLRGRVSGTGSKRCFFVVGLPSALLTALARRRVGDRSSGVRFSAETGSACSDYQRHHLNRRHWIRLWTQLPDRRENDFYFLNSL